MHMLDFSLIQYLVYKESTVKIKNVHTALRRATADLVGITHSLDTRAKTFPYHGR